MPLLMPLLIDAPLIRSLSMCMLVHGRIHNMVTVSFIVNWAYDLVSLSVSEVTRKKLRFLSGSKEYLAKSMSELPVS
jgi:hypothetical protein